MLVAESKSAKTSSLGEQRVVFDRISWVGYEQLLGILGESRSTRLTYDRGLLEITMPSQAHENSNELIGVFIRMLVFELGMNIKSMGSTTLNRPDLLKGAEPDNCYYIQNEPVVRGRTIDLDRDPPPDLVVEVDITHTDINKLSLYAAIGVPEFWRYDGEILRLYQLQANGVSGGEYLELDTSPTFPQISKEMFYQFLDQCRIEGESQAMRNFRGTLASR